MILQKIPRLAEVEAIIETCAGIFGRLGFKGEAAYSGSGRQIIFDNQMFVGNSSFTLQVVALENPESMTFNFEFRNLPGQSSAVSLQEREIKRLAVQLTEGESYKQLSFQVYFEKPLSWQGEDLVFRVGVKQSPEGPKIKLGFPWISPQTHMSGVAVLELVQKISSLLK